MTSTFVEYREIPATGPLRQGDVLESTDDDASKWQRHLLVITADCDFANAKHQGRVTCVPLLTKDEYHLEFQIPKIREKVLHKCVSQLQTVLHKSSSRTITTRRLRDWPVEENPEDIVGLLALEGDTAEDALTLLTAIRSIRTPCDDLDGAVDRLVSAQISLPNSRRREKVLAEVLDTLRGHYSRPPGDALFLSAVAPSLDNGYFAYLRHLEQIREPQIALGPSRGEVSYRRLARLQDRFILAVAQQFALVFMSIGLPDEYEEIRDLHSELLGDRYQ